MRELVRFLFIGRMPSAPPVVVADFGNSTNCVFWLNVCSFDNVNKRLKDALFYPEWGKKKSVWSPARLTVDAQESNRPENLLREKSDTIRFRIQINY